MWESVSLWAGFHILVGLDRLYIRRAGAAEHRIGAGGRAGAQGGKGVYLPLGCPSAGECVRVWSVQACVMSAQGLQAGGAISVCVDPLEHGCVSTCVFVCV